MPERTENNIIYTGETFSIQTEIITIIGIQKLFNLIPADLPKHRSGAAISATTAGRIPLKIRSITGLSLNWVNNIAINSITTKDGRIIPTLVDKLPLKPSLFLPTNIAVLREIGPGTDCANASISINSSSASHFFLFTTSLRIRGIIAYPPPKVKAPILKKTKNSSQYCFARFICGVLKVKSRLQFD